MERGGGEKVWKTRGPVVHGDVKRKGCEIVRGRKRKLQGEMGRGMGCRRREGRGLMGSVVGR